MTGSRSRRPGLPADLRRFAAARPQLNGILARHHAAAAKQGDRRPGRQSAAGSARAADQRAFIGQQLGSTSSPPRSPPRAIACSGIRRALFQRGHDPLDRIFAEVLPKTVAFNAPDRFALTVARPIAWTCGCSRPPGGDRALVNWLLRRSHAVARDPRSYRRTRSCAARSTCALPRRRRESTIATCSAACFDLRDLTVSDVISTAPR